MAFFVISTIASVTPIDAGPTGSYGWALLQMLLALTGVCILAWFTLNYGIRRLFRAASGRGLVRVHERSALEPRKSLYVVEVAGSFYLVGSAEGGLTTLAALDAEKVQGALAAKQAQSRPSGASFTDILRRATSRAAPATPGSKEKP